MPAKNCELITCNRSSHDVSCRELSALSTFNSQCSIKNLSQQLYQTECNKNYSIRFHFGECTPKNISQPKKAKLCKTLKALKVERCCFWECCQLRLTTAERYGMEIDCDCKKVFRFYDRLFTNFGGSFACVIFAMPQGSSRCDLGKYCFDDWTLFMNTES